jgi:hypothetical protein
MTRLTGQQIVTLSETLSATLNFDDLESVVYASTGDRLYNEYVGPGSPLKPTIRKLLEALEQLGTTKFFLAYVYKIRRVHRPDVAEAIKNAFPEAAVEPPQIDGDVQVQVAGERQEQGPNKAAAPGFERNIRPNLAQLDLHIWLEKLARIERRVCRIESNGNAAGTGFLVGPDAVLTNWHVVQGSIHGDVIEEMICRFDYYRLIDNTRQPGVPVAVLGDGCVSHRSYSQAETTDTPESPEATEDELDYALLRLTQTIGNTKAGGSPRGWVSLPDYRVALPVGAPLLIVQHPDGAPLKLALDTNAIIGLNAAKTRIRYTTNTESGSSGSPCFNMDWQLAALHHYGDPAWQNAKFNQGVPAELIRRKIVADGFAALLGSAQRL